ncbi:MULTISPECIES: IclR family transcriptional regulator [unclassified Rhizobium]|uniref:IclR family transcriptional regulator n=1 Tax=unclassified Rhizobium TaxID=2613769 RepID=UPI001A9900BF|nr:MULTISPECIES: IclR family transcriptional regulator [unclassified Rhizobium]MBX5185521.1 IclR family transcriptional regulator [Rhizobium sp. NZLR5]MBX5187312.1 IclR family transcriptional regulator [Rhizobium sp. NZLR3b]MBX5200423.1 IclR family transcriptional regulator [Rhizobium sp. NZLR1]QSZ23332.1 IclR family transcriptional regulator [Rhizobium sp. NZLR1]
MSTIGKALSLLDTLSRLDKEAGLTDIARLCALDKATTRRFLVELEKHGFVEQDPDTRRYRIGSAPVRLARIREARYPFLRVAIPFIKALAETSMETVHFSEFSGGRLSTIHVEDSPRAHRVIVEVGIPLPFHATASGLAFLAFCPPAEIDEALEKPLEKFTDHTVVDPGRVRDLLQETAARGFSISHQGLEAGVVSTAAPIRAPGGHPVGCVAIAAPLARITKAAIDEFGAQAITAADAISEKYYGSERPMGTSVKIRRTDR